MELRKTAPGLLIPSNCTVYREASFLLQLRSSVGKKLIDDFARHSFDHALSDGSNHPANLRLARVVQLGLPILFGELHAAFSVHETRNALPRKLHAHRVGRLL